MIDYLEIRSMCHSAFTEEEKARRKAELKPLNRDFLIDLPSQVRDIMDQLCWSYKDQPWFEEAWEKYRKHVLDAGLGGKIKMPGFVFNEYIDRYVDEQEKRRNKELAHMETCDVDELYHHGIKGQRWGVRRYQNEDGTLTEEGKARYAEYEKQLNEESRQFTNKIALRNYSKDDRGAVLAGLVEKANDDAVAAYNRGQKLIDKMKKEGLINGKVEFKDYIGKYEKQLIDKNLHKYRLFVKEEYGRDLTEKDIEWMYYMFSQPVEDTKK